MFGGVDLPCGPCGAIAVGLMFGSREGREEAKGAKGLGMEIEEIAAIAVDCGLQVHRRLGPGLLESAYETVLAHVLSSRGLQVRRQIVIPITFDDLVIDQGFRADILVESKLLIELKSVEQLAPVHRKQVLTYLRFLNLPLGLLMNFSAETFQEGMARIVNNHKLTKGSTLRIHQ